MKKFITTSVVTARLAIPAESEDKAREWVANHFPSEIEITLENGEAARINLTLEDIPSVNPESPLPAPAKQEMPKRYPKSAFFKKYAKTGNYREAIFQGRPALMQEIYDSGCPIYCDQSYYCQEDGLDLVEKAGDHFHCAGYKTFEEWRDCHYYHEYADDCGNRVWVMSGGRYD